MRIHSSSPHRGLLAGLLALITFASSAVAVTAGNSPGATAQTQPAQTIVLPDGGDRRDAALLEANGRGAPAMVAEAACTLARLGMPQTAIQAEGFE